MGLNLYTQANVQFALLRATVSMLLISQNISKGFFYMNSKLYNLYRELQYDIYCLWSVIVVENQFMVYSDWPPSTYEQNFYLLVGAMIAKTDMVDVFGAYGGSINPNYQSPNYPIIIPGGGTFTPTIINKTDADLVFDITNQQWYLPFLDQNDNPLSANTIPVFVTTNGVSFNYIFDDTFYPPRIYGFTGNYPQTIVVTCI